MADKPATNADNERAITGWRAFQFLARWIWMGDVPFFTKSGAFDLSKQAIGFGGSHRIDMLRDLSESFTKELHEDSLADLIEIALEDELAVYDLGLRPTVVHGFMDSANVMHFYVKADNEKLVARRAPQKAALRATLEEAGLLEMTVHSALAHEAFIQNKLAQGKVMYVRNPDGSFIEVLFPPEEPPEPVGAPVG